MKSSYLALVIVAAFLLGGCGSGGGEGAPVGLPVGLADTPALGDSTGGLDPTPGSAGHDQDLGSGTDGTPAPVAAGPEAGGIPGPVPSDPVGAGPGPGDDQDPGLVTGGDSPTPGLGSGGDDQDPGLGSGDDDQDPGLGTGDDNQDPGLGSGDDDQDPGLGSGDDDDHASSVKPILLEEWQTGSAEVECGQLGEFNSWYKLDTDDVDDIEGTWDFDGLTVYVAIADDGIYWEASDVVGAVVAKGGVQANAYLYEGGEVSDGGLNPPTNPVTGNPYGLGHVTFCWNSEEEGE